MVLTLKKIFFILSFVLLLVPFLWGQQQGDESLFNKKITIEKDELTVGELLNIISAKSGVFFSYDASVVVSDRQLNLTKVENTIYEILSQVFDEKLFRFVEKKDHIIIALIEKSTSTDSLIIVDEKGISSSDYLRVSGKIVDSKKFDPIPFANISIKGKTFGTITNLDGEFILKIHPEEKEDTVLFSSLGYSPKAIPVKGLSENELIQLRESAIEIEEIKVVPITPDYVMDMVYDKIKVNYSSELMTLKAFYRETLKQDDNYINVSEAIIEVLKAPYSNSFKADKVRLLKNRQSTNESAFQWVKFKLQGGPKTITQLDLVKTMESFLDPEFRGYYNFKISKILWHLNRPVYIIEFKPVKGFGLLFYEGEMYVDRETYVVMHINFRMGKSSLRSADKSLIKKKPTGYKVRTQSLEYHVDYTQSRYKWCLSSARASAVFKIRGKKERLNSTFHSVSEILVTDIEKSQIKRFPKGQLFSINDIFTDEIKEYDEKFWGNFNIIKPNADLREALKYFDVNSSLNKIGIY